MWQLELFSHISTLYFVCNHKLSTLDVLAPDAQVWMIGLHTYVRTYIHYITLHYITLHYIYITLHCIALHYITLPYIHTYIQYMLYQHIFIIYI